MTALATVPAVTDPRELALLKAIGLDRVSPEQRELALNIANRYELDLMLKHLVLIDGRPYVTRDGLLHIAHRSGVFDGIEVSIPEVVDGFWRCTASVYRKDMGRPFTFPGRYPAQGGNQKYAPEMAIKVAESMALRRAFNIAAPTVDEHDIPDVAPVPVAPKPTLAQRVAEKAETVATRSESSGGDGWAPNEYGSTGLTTDEAAAIATGVTYDAEPVPVAEGQEPLDLTEPPATVTTDQLGLTVEALSDLARAAGFGSRRFATALEVVPADVGKTIAAMTDIERYDLALIMGLVS